MDETTLINIINSLKLRMGITEEHDVAILTEILNDAITEIMEARHYPSDMSASDIESDMQKFISNIKKLSKYDYNQIGAELQSSHNENGVSRQYIDRRKCFDGIVPYCRQF